MRDGHPVVDAHVHVIHGAIDSAFSEPSGKASRSPVISAEEAVARMDRYGVDQAVLIAHAWSDTSIEEMRREHDIIAADIRRYPGRFVGVCTADPRQGQQAVDEVRRAVEELDYRGLKLLPSFHYYLVDSAIVDPLMQVAVEYELPVLYCSQWHFYGAEPWRWVRLARRYPELTFVMCHMGIDPYVTESLVVPHMVADVPNIVLETSATTTDPYGVFAGPVEILGAERVMWGSDGGPFLHPELELLKLDLAGLSPDDKQMVLGGTAARVFGIEHDPPH
jgi:uncharacterized protein